MQTDVCIRIINEKMNIKFLVRWVFDVPAIIAFGFNRLFLILLKATPEVRSSSGLGWATPHWETPNAVTITLGKF